MSEFGSLLDRKTICVVTGASRGIGKEIALRLGRRFGAGSRFLLVARNDANLAETARELVTSDPGLTVERLICDLSRLTDGTGAEARRFEEALQRTMAGDTYELAIVVHNAATVGDLTRKVSQVNDGGQMLEYLGTNLVSYMLLNNIFLRLVTTKVAAHRLVINITSLLAVKSFPGLGMYAIGKAAREAYARSLACEDPDVRVLNYSPGPVQTDMQTEVQTLTYDDNTRTSFQNSAKSGNMLTTEQTVTKFLKVLQENKFENAAHVDYYDIA